VKLVVLSQRVSHTPKLISKAIKNGNRAYRRRQRNPKKCEG